MKEYETIVVEQVGRVRWLRLNRTDALNALNTQLMHDLVDAATAADEDDAVGAIVVVGNGRAFAAGADIKEMADQTTAQMHETNHFGPWLRFAQVRKPVIAAVHGYALGGGLELALMCDVIIAAEDAKLGFPEIGLGVIPGIGGTQRLLRIAGYPRAAELILTGRRIDAAEALAIGMVSRVVAADALLDEVGALATQIAGRSLPALVAAKATLDAALETGLEEGLALEAEQFTGLFDTADQKEGMAAFVEKREPDFQHR